MSSIGKALRERLLEEAKGSDDPKDKFTVAKMECELAYAEYCEFKANAKGVAWEHAKKDIDFYIAKKAEIEAKHAKLKEETDRKAHDTCMRVMRDIISKS